MDYGGRFLKIRKAIHEAGFDEFHQAGSVNRFHNMNIVAESTVLGMQYWFCIDRGYGTKETFFIIQMKTEGDVPSNRTYYRNQADMAGAIRKIGEQIREAKAEEARDAEGLAVRTPLGWLIVKTSVDPENPGIYIDLRREGCDCDAPVAMVEVTRSEADSDGETKLVTRIWDNVEMEDHQTRVVHSGIEHYFGDGV